MKTFMSLNSDVHLLWLNCFSLTATHHENHMFQFVNVHVCMRMHMYMYIIQFLDFRFILNLD